MRLWHKGLIDVLPDKQLRGQWRECCLIAKALHEGNLNHLLVNKVKDYTDDEFNRYTSAVIAAMQKRGYRVYAWRFYQWRRPVTVPSATAIFDGWHNKRYLLQCLYNLQEKYDCGGITGAEWATIENKFRMEAL